MYPLPNLWSSLNTLELPVSEILLHVTCEPSRIPCSCLTSDPVTWNLLRDLVLFLLTSHRLDQALSFVTCIMTFAYRVLSSALVLLCYTFWSSTVVSLSFLSFQKLLVSARILSSKQWKPSPANSSTNGSIDRLLGSFTKLPGRQKNWASKKGRHKGDHTARGMPKPGHRDREGICCHLACDVTVCPASSLLLYSAITCTCDTYLKLSVNWEEIFLLFLFLCLTWWIQDQGMCNWAADLGPMPVPLLLASLEKQVPGIFSLSLRRQSWPLQFWHWLECVCFSHMTKQFSDTHCIA